MTAAVTAAVTDVRDRTADRTAVREPVDTVEIPVAVDLRGEHLAATHDAVSDAAASDAAGSDPAASTAVDGVALPVLASSVWTARTVLVATVLFAGSLLGIGISWYGVSGRATFGTQQPWLVGGVFALVVGALGGVVVIGAGMRRVRLAQRAHLPYVRQLFELPNADADEELVRARDAALGFGPGFRPGPGTGLAPAASSPPAGPGPAPVDAWVTSDGMTRRHRPTCLLVAGKDVRAVRPRERLESCGVCDS